MNFTDARVFSAIIVVVLCHIFDYLDEYKNQPFWIHDSSNEILNTQSRDFLASADPLVSLLISISTLSLIHLTRYGHNILATKDLKGLIY